MAASAGAQRRQQVGRGARHGGQDGHRVSVVDLGVQGAQETDILVVDVYIDEPVQAAILGDKPGAQARVLAVEIGQQVVNGVPGALDGLLTAGVGAEDGGN